MWLFAAFVAVPITEIALFIEVGGWLGLWPTIGIVILTAIIGSVLLRTQGLTTMETLKARLAAGQDPSATLAHGAMILVAGVLLLTPGFFTDGVGISLLLPPVRAAVIGFLASRMQNVRVSAATGTTQHTWTSGDPDIVDGTFENITPDKPANSTGKPTPPPIAGRDES